MPVRALAMNVQNWIDRLGLVWIEGQVAQLRSRAGAGLVWITLRDPLADVSVSVTAKRQVFDIVDPPIVEGAKVLVCAKAEYYMTRGSLSFAAREIRPVGVGDLLARLERLKRLLAAEGLFAAELKRPLPFLPRRVGLVCGRDSAAEHDVLKNARARWPAVEFEVRNVPVQGTQAVQQILLCLEELDRDPVVDVIVLTRGGGSLEDLLPFSDEGLLRAVAKARTPVVSAIGHETDAPLLDLVADVRASTPTDAARRIVPDVAEERAGVANATATLRTALRRRIEAERTGLGHLRAHPAPRTHQPPRRGRVAPRPGPPVHPPPADPGRRRHRAPRRPRAGAVTPGDSEARLRGGAGRRRRRGAHGRPAHPGRHRARLGRRRTVPGSHRPAPGQARRHRQRNRHPRRHPRCCVHQTPGRRRTSRPTRPRRGNR